MLQRFRERLWWLMASGGLSKEALVWGTFADLVLSRKDLSAK